MAKNSYGNNRNYNEKGSKKKSKYTDLERMAYKMGVIMTSLPNDTRITDSYEAGCAVRETKSKKKKPLY